MITLGRAGPLGEPDMSLLAELFEEIERHPPGIEARKLLINHYTSINRFEDAHEAAAEARKLAPQDPEINNLFASTKSIQNAEPAAQGKSYNLKSALRHSVSAANTPWNTVGWATKATSGPPGTHSPYPLGGSSSPTAAVESSPSAFQDGVSGVDHAEQQELVRGYEALLKRAKNLLHETTMLRDLTKDRKNDGAPPPGILTVIGSFFAGKRRPENVSERFEKHIPDLVALADGRVGSVVRVRKPGGVKMVAKAMQTKAVDPVDVAFQDLEDMARWLGSPSNNGEKLDNDSIRDTLLKRVQALDAVLSEKFKVHASTAFMHVEHEVLRKRYIGGDTTMLGDPVSEIPRSNFYVTEDGYPWDMDELAQAITANGGVMRNPLSRQMFTTNDIRAIVSHPLGKHLAAMEIEQKKLKMGVRPTTIDQLDKLQKVLLGDQSADSIPSRHAVDDFMAFLATLPMGEQTSLDKLRVPAIDSHTGQKFDTSIGEAVRDAQGNRVCFHKTGDLIRQAVAHLRKK